MITPKDVKRKVDGVVHYEEKEAFLEWLQATEWEESISMGGSRIAVAKYKKSLNNSTKQYIINTMRDTGFYVSQTSVGLGVVVQLDEEH